MMVPDFLFLVLVFFLIALIYSSVGFGGGSSYLALLALSGVAFEMIRPIALLCNIVVVTGGTYIYYKNGHLNLRQSWPFLALSIPLAYVGGWWRLEERTFFLTLSVVLIAAAVILWLQPTSENSGKRSGSLAFNASVGGGIGFLSGLVGIGGGIFLSPILHFFKWDDAKKISALASLFILVNSVSGLLGQFQRGIKIDWTFTGALLLAVLAGGQIGSRMGARRLSADVIRKITAVLILVAGLNILKDQL